MYLKKHKTLDKKIWATPEHLKQDVVETLLAMVWDFIDFIRYECGIDIKNQDVKDVILYGSCANYFYNKNSDIDICILLDTKSLEETHPGVDVKKQLTLCHYTWLGMNNKLKIHGRDVEIKITNVASPKIGDRYKTGPNYSVLHNNWIFKPVNISDAELKQINEKAKTLYKWIMRDYYELKKNGFNQQDALALYIKICNDRHCSVHLCYKQTITPMYVAFKEIKKHGVMKKLKTVIEQSNKHLQ